MPPEPGVRLLLVGDFPPPLGGVSVHVRALAQAARKAGAHVTVLDVGKGQHDEEGVIASGRAVRFAVSLATLAASHELLHVHTSGANARSWLLAAAVGAAARVTGHRAVATLHSGHGPRYLSTPSRALAARVALAPYDRVVCVTEEISRALDRIGAAPQRHLVAPAFGREGLEPGALPAAARAFRDEHPVVMSAMLAPGPDYGARELFSAFARLRRQGLRAGLAVFGPGTDDDSTRQLAGQLGASPLLALGALERGVALAVVAHSDVFVRPTRVDGDSVSVREALALGRRVVATRVGTRPAGVHLCEPADEGSLARALAEALAGPPPAAVDEGADGIDTVLHLYARLAAASPGRAA